MVRKWSYLEGPQATSLNSPLVPLSKLYNFKVFRKTTRFKKFNKGITKMVRKKYSRRKHITSWITLSFITKSWTLNYLKARQFERFFTSLGFFNCITHSPILNVFTTRLPLLAAKNNGVSISSCSKNIAYRFIRFSKYQSTHYLTDRTKNTNLSLMHTSHPQNIVNYSDIFPSTVKFDNSFYSPLDIYTLVETQNLNSTFNNALVQYNLSIVSSTRSILVLISLYNLKRPH